MPGTYLAPADLKTTLTVPAGLTVEHIFTPGQRFYYDFRLANLSSLNLTYIITPEGSTDVATPDSSTLFAGEGFLLKRRWSERRLSFFNGGATDAQVQIYPFVPASS